MSKVNKSRRPTKFRIALIDHYTHQQLASVKISKTGLFIAIVTIVVAFSAVNATIVVTIAMINPVLLIFTEASC